LAGDVWHRTAPALGLYRPSADERLDGQFWLFDLDPNGFLAI
jgi:hypothetical protein